MERALYQISITIISIDVYSDQNPLSFINKMKNINHRLLRGSLYLQEYNIEVRHIKGKDIVIPDTLSRWPKGSCIVKTFFSFRRGGFMPKLQLIVSFILVFGTVVLFCYYHVLVMEF